MEVTHYPKYTLYALLIIGSWFFTCLLHFRSFHLFGGSGGGGVDFVVLPFSLNSSFHASGIAAADDRRPSSSSCDGRYVYMVDLPSQFDFLKECVDGSPSFENRYSRCFHMSNAGIGPELNSSDDDAGGIVPATGWYNTNQYALEVIFHHRMRRYDCLTDDPAAATAVYVPYYPATDLHPHMCGFNSSVRNGPALAMLRWLSSRPAWAARGGRDHFMVASKTSWVFRAVGGDDLRCGNSLLEQPEARNMTALTYETNLWADAPPSDFAVPYPTYFHPSSAAQVAAWQARVRAAPRPWLYAFAGARRPNGTLAIRDRIFDACDAPRGRRRCGLLDCRAGCDSPRKVVALFASAHFCLQPPGDSYMRRSAVDALIAGCIPVFFRPASTFEKQYLWHEPDPSCGERRRPYYVLINQFDVVAGKVDIEETLGKYTDDEITAMREEVIKMIPRFLYKDPRVKFEGDMKDGFDIAMDALMARMKRIKNGEDMGWKTDNTDAAAVVDNAQ
ncbi:hypothetical protein EJB05_41326 [Eragrostis curvula]|uniref:Exostosin GT47 domain-containing protein n=1 Tax=Eragrostis curvula TaxID=38414 RepID=A0A5J9TAH1_9POAL|nr:hypothetical protein EJB05_41326 [Eragrostis curvula]